MQKEDLSKENKATQITESDASNGKNVKAEKSVKTDGS